MGIALEAINIITRIETIERKYPGGFSALKQSPPNATFCYDKNITKISFMTYTDVGDWIKFLETFGFIHTDEFLNSVDICIWDTNTGPTTQCDWLQFNELMIFKDNFTYPIIRLAGDKNDSFSHTEGYIEHMKSLHYSPNGLDLDKFKLLEKEDGVQTIAENETGKKFYIGERNIFEREQEKDKEFILFKLVSDRSSDEKEENQDTQKVLNILNSIIKNGEINNIESLLIYMCEIAKDAWGIESYYKAIKNALYYFDGINLRVRLITGIYELIKNKKGDTQKLFEELREELTRLDFVRVPIGYAEAMLYIDFVSMNYFGLVPEALKNLKIFKKITKTSRKFNENIDFFSKNPFDVNHLLDL